jgi:hypothetical protein
MPRWNFTDVFRSFMIVFRVLCGEWIESMWDCLNAHGWPCVPFFLGVKIIGGFVVNIRKIFVLKILFYQNFRFLICSFAYFWVNLIATHFNRIQTQKMMILR